MIDSFAPVLCSSVAVAQCGVGDWAGRREELDVCGRR